MREKLVEDIAKLEADIMQLRTALQQISANLVGAEGALQYAKKLLESMDSEKKESADGLHNP